MRHYNLNAAINLAGVAQLELHRSIAEDWFFNKEHAPVARTTRQQMLRTLKHEIPAQMRETNEVGLCLSVFLLRQHEFTCPVVNKLVPGPFDTNPPRRARDAAKLF